jgi:hypothetical protein
VSHRRIVAGRSRAVRTLLALAAISAGLGTVAYAATRPGGHDAVAGADPRRGGGNAPAKKRRQTQPPPPRFLEVPAAPSIGAQAQFRFHLLPRAQGPSRRPPGLKGGTPPPPRRFQCRLDESEWAPCDSPHLVDGLAPGPHEFTVRALSPAGRPGSAVHSRWEQLESKPFSVEPRIDALEDLYPGDPAQALPVLITNPNPAPIVLTSLTVTVATAPPGCPAEPNFAPTASSISPATPLTVPAGTSVSLPSATATAPAIALRDAPVNQDACKGAEVPLVFSGEAHG